MDNDSNCFKRENTEASKLKQNRMAERHSRLKGDRNCGKNFDETYPSERIDCDKLSKLHVKQMKSNTVNYFEDPLLIMKAQMASSRTHRSTISKFLKRTVLQAESHNKAMEKSIMWDKFEKDQKHQRY